MRIALINLRAFIEEIQDPQIETLNRANDLFYFYYFKAEISPLKPVNHVYKTATDQAVISADPLSGLLYHNSFLTTTQTSAKSHSYFPTANIDLNADPYKYEEQHLFEEISEGTIYEMEEDKSADIFRDIFRTTAYVSDEELEEASSRMPYQQSATATSQSTFSATPSPEITIDIDTVPSIVSSESPMSTTSDFASMPLESHIYTSISLSEDGSKKSTSEMPYQQPVTASALSTFSPFSEIISDADTVPLISSKFFISAISRYILTSTPAQSDMLQYSASTSPNSDLISSTDATGSLVPILSYTSILSPIKTTQAHIDSKADKVLMAFNGLHRFKPGLQDNSVAKTKKVLNRSKFKKSEISSIILLIYHY